MSSKLIFISSLAHSGSTVLDLLLGSHPDIISLGEIYSAIEEFNKPQRICTCGREVPNCRVWGPVRRELDKKSHYTFAEAYKILFKVVEDVYGKDKIIVDSSKWITPLKLVSEEFNDKLYTLFLLKDIRSFVYSMGLNERRKIQRKKEWDKIYKASFPYNTVLWFWHNLQLKQYITNHSFRYLQLGYEELCFHPKEILKKVCNFLGIEFVEDMLKPENSESHIIRGNEMRYDRNKLKGIYYDNRWFYDYRQMLLGWVLLPFLYWNNQNVYSNIKK